MIRCYRLRTASWTGRLVCLRAGSLDFLNVVGTITPGSRTFYQYGVKVASAESELLPLKVVLRFRCFPTTFTGKKFANRVNVKGGQFIGNGDLQIDVRGLNSVLQQEIIRLRRSLAQWLRSRGGLSLPP